MFTAISPNSTLTGVHNLFFIITNTYYLLFKICINKGEGLEYGFLIILS